MFTFIMDFRGGIYVSQVKSKQLTDAIIEWGGNLNLDEIKHLGPAGKAEIVELLKEEEPILLKGLTNVWCLSFSIKQGFAIVNVVRTALS